MNRTLLVFLMLAVLIAVVVPAEAQRVQPGATQGGPTSGEEMMPLFSPTYLEGDWEIEWSPPETELLPGGKWTGIETISHVNNRYMRVTSYMENEDGTVVKGDGLIIYDFGLTGQGWLRFVSYDVGFSIFEHGSVGGDLGGYYSAFWEAEPIEFKDHTFQLTGRTYFVSPAAYRTNHRISMDGEPALNFGILWKTKMSKGMPAGQ